MICTSQDPHNYKKSLSSEDNQMPESYNPNLDAPGPVIVDTHAHIYHKRFDTDQDEMIGRARAAGVETILMTAIDVASIHSAIQLCEKHEGLFAMTAIHPSDTKDATEDDFGAVEDFCNHPKIVAVGESGLDYYWDRSFDEKQQDFFRRHIRLAIEHDLPLILHMRDKQGRDEVDQDMVAILKEERASSASPKKLRGIFHCFGGPQWLIQEAIDLKFLLGIGGTLTFKNSGVADLVKDIPLEHIVLETDAPFLAPVPYRGKRNEPAYTRLVAEKLAEVKGMDVAEVGRVTTRTAKEIFGLV